MSKDLDKFDKSNLPDLPPTPTPLPVAPAAPQTVTPPPQPTTTSATKAKTTKTKDPGWTSRNKAIKPGCDGPIIGKQKDSKQKTKNKQDKEKEDNSHDDHRTSEKTDETEQDKEDYNSRDNRHDNHRTTRREKEGEPKNVAHDDKKSSIEKNGKEEDKEKPRKKSSSSRKGKEDKVKDDEEGEENSSYNEEKPRENISSRKVREEEEHSSQHEKPSTRKKEKDETKPRGKSPSRKGKGHEVEDEERLSQQDEKFGKKEKKSSSQGKQVDEMGNKGWSNHSPSPTKREWAMPTNKRDVSNENPSIQEKGMEEENDKKPSPQIGVKIGKHEKSSTSPKESSQSKHSNSTTDGSSANSFDTVDKTIQGVRDCWNKACETIEELNRSRISSWILDCQVVLALHGLHKTESDSKSSDSKMSPEQKLYMVVICLQQTREKISKELETIFRLFSHAKDSLVPIELREAYNKLSSQKKTILQADSIKAMVLKYQVTAPLRGLSEELEKLEKCLAKDPKHVPDQDLKNSLHTHLVEHICQYKTVKPDLRRYLTKATILLANINNPVGILPQDERTKLNAKQIADCRKLYDKIKVVQTTPAENPTEEVIQYALNTVMKSMFLVISQNGENKRKETPTPIEDDVINKLLGWFDATLKSLHETWVKEVSNWIIDCHVVLAVINLRSTPNSAKRTSDKKCLQALGWLQQTHEDLKKNVRNAFRTVSASFKDHMPPELYDRVMALPGEKLRKVTLPKLSEANEMKSYLIGPLEFFSPILSGCETQILGKARVADKKQKSIEKPSFLDDIYKVNKEGQDKIRTYLTTATFQLTQACNARTTSAPFPVQECDNLYIEMERFVQSSSDDSKNNFLLQALKDVMGKLLPFTSRKS